MHTGTIYEGEYKNEEICVVSWRELFKMFLWMVQGTKQAVKTW